MDHDIATATVILTMGPGLVRILSRWGGFSAEISVRDPRNHFSSSKPSRLRLPRAGKFQRGDFIFTLGDLLLISFSF